MRFTRQFPIFRLTIAGGGAFLLFFCGCASKTHPRAGAVSTQGSPSLLVGEVAVVDEEERFVLIDLGSNLYVPDAGVLLHSTNARGEPARLKTSQDQKRPFVAADIIDGKPTVGDEVVR